MHCTLSNASYFCITSLSCSGLAADQLVYKQSAAKVYSITKNAVHVMKSIYQCCVTRVKAVKN